MSTQKRLSHLSIAAAALLTVAGPSFAQTKSADTTTDLTTSARQVVAFNSELIANPFDTLNHASENKTGLATTTAPAKPKLVASQFSVNENNVGFTKSQTNFYQVRFEDSNQFDSESGSSSKQITFVPSRGPKYPW